MSAPFLRIEVGLHAGLPRRASTDREGRLLTGGDDCTARLWDTATGELLRVLRPPIGTGHQGKVFAVALSPDGAMAAMGGVLAESTGYMTRVFTCGAQDGELLWTSEPIIGYIRQMVFTPKGDRLVVSTSSLALLLVDAADGRVVAKCGDMVSDVYGVVTDGEHIWLTSFDGTLRMYDMGLALKKKVKIGAQGYQLSLSEDGKKLVIGMNNSTAIEVRSAQTLKLLYKPDVSGIPSGGYLCAVCFSGDHLYAAGTWYDRGRMVRRWEKGGRGAHLDRRIQTAESVLCIAPLPAGIVCLGQPWAVLDGPDPRPPTAGLIAAWQAGPTLQLSDDARTVRFRWNDKPDDWGSFSVKETRMTAVDSAPLRPPRTDGLAVTDWNGNYAPKLNGSRLPMEAWEASRSLAVSDDASLFVIGAEFNLRCFSANGQHRWTRPMPGAAWSVNLSADGQILVAMLSNGTICWHRAGDGALLLTLFPHAERQPWVCWTPSGYYSVAPGTDELIGWHVNREPLQTADFFPISRFSQELHHPDAPRAVLDCLDEVAGLRSIGLVPIEVTGSLPPVLKLEEVWMVDGMLKIQVSGRSPGGQPIDRVWARVDGRPAWEEVTGSGPWTLTLQISPFATQVAVFGASGESVSVALIVPPARLKALLLPPQAAEAAHGGASSADAPIAADAGAVAAPIQAAPRAAPDDLSVRPAPPPGLAGAAQAKAAPSQRFRALIVGQDAPTTRALTQRLSAEAREMDFRGGLDWLRQEPAGLSILVMPAPEGRARDLRFPDAEKPVTGRELQRAVEGFPGKLWVIIGHGDADLSVLLERLGSPEVGAMVLAAPPGLARALERTEGASVEELARNLCAASKGAGVFMRARTATDVEIPAKG